MYGLTEMEYLPDGMDRLIQLIDGSLDESVFTIVSSKTGRSYTYRITKHPDKPLWFVKFLVRVNSPYYAYLGIIFTNSWPDPKTDYVFTLTGKSRYTKVSRPFIAFDWVFYKVMFNLPIKNSKIFPGEYKVGKPTKQKDFLRVIT